MGVRKYGKVEDELTHPRLEVKARQRNAAPCGEEPPDCRLRRGQGEEVKGGVCMYFGSYIALRDKKKEGSSRSELVHPID